ncbi:MAG: hypothetical protein ACLGIN_18665 [Candidatus Sericytochromatia bacterium]
MKRSWIGLGLAPLMVACPQGDGAQPPPEAPPAVAVQVAGGAAQAPGAYRSDWRAVPEGEPPGEFRDVRRDGHRQSWLYDGGWRITHRTGSPVLEVPFALREPREPLSFQRYVGSAFGPDGALPVRYRIEAEARSLGESARFRGYGELAIQALYLSPVSYVEVLQTDEHLFIWEARNAPPMQGQGWKALAKGPHSAKVGQWLTFGAEVDRERGTIRALLDGRVVAEAKSRLITPEAEARFTLRATGNREEWRWVRVDALP